MSTSSSQTRYSIATIILDVIGILLGLAWLGIIAIFAMSQYKDMAAVLGIITLFVIIVALWNEFGLFE